MIITAHAVVSRGARILQSPIGWMAVGVVLVGGFSTLAGAGPVLALLGTALALATYVLVMRVLARRQTPELALRRAGRELLIGAGIGAGFLVTSVAVITVLGGYTFTTLGAAGLRALPGLVAVSVAGAVTEELLFRGLVLQAVEELRGPRTALVVSSALFGLVHLLNPGASLWSSVAIAVEAGGLLGAAFLWRRSLWLAIALHATWNGLEQLLGIPVSGHVDPSVLVATVHGPTMLSGGDFGLEASLITVIISLIITATLLRRTGAIRAKDRAPRGFSQHEPTDLSRS